jgi:hypothetical protein
MKLIKIAIIVLDLILIYATMEQGFIRKNIMGASLLVSTLLIANIIILIFKL